MQSNLKLKRFLLVWCSAAIIAGAVYARDVVSLAGDWEYRLDEERQGVAKAWYAGAIDSAGEIALPGTLDDAGIGPREKMPKPFFGPVRKHCYVGTAWYQRDIEVPSAWKGKRLALFLERCRWVTEVWLDDRRIGTEDSLVTPHVYELGTDLAAGRHRLTIRVDNRLKYELGIFVSALFGGTPGSMNGIVGRIELQATPPVWLDDVQVHPNVSEMMARVAVEIGNATGAAGKGILQVAGTKTPVTWTEAGGRAEVTVDMKGAKLWDEFSPNLQTFEVSLGDHRRLVRFGMRSFAVENGKFTLNGRPIFLRGTLECSVWPLTGYPPTDPGAWRRIYRIMKEHGLNHVRFHSWTPPGAAFTAADELGIIVQSECPQANVHMRKVPARDRFIGEEARRILRHYGNHASFCLMTMGNELYGQAAPMQILFGELARADPRRLYSTDSCGFDRKRSVGHGHFHVSTHGRGVHAPGTSHVAKRVSPGSNIPAIGHEIGQWTFYPQFEKIKKYSGVLELDNFVQVRESLESRRMLGLAPLFLAASGKQAMLLYKEEAELMLRSPDFAGLQLLDLHDYPKQGTALIGPLDEFWESKGIITPKAFREFCGETVPLLRLPRRVYTTAESLQAEVEVAHYGAADLNAARGEWSLRGARGQRIARGTFDATDVRTGGLTSLGSLDVPLGGVKAPAKVEVVVELASFRNRWNIWVYPEGGAPGAPDGVTVCCHWEDAAVALHEGKRVVLFPEYLAKSRWLPGKFLPVFWSPVWFPKQKPNTMGLLCRAEHPVFKLFPTDIHSDWQWWHLVNASRALILDGTPAGFRPMVQVIDNFTRNHKLGTVFEAVVGEGRLLVCVMDLPKLAVERPEARQLLKSLYSYAGSSDFLPEHTLTMEVLSDLFGAAPLPSLARRGAQATAKSEAPGYEAKLAIDGRADTFWHAAWEPEPKPLPQTLTVDLGKPTAIAAVTYLPRQDMSNGRIAEGEVLADGKVVARVKWGDTTALQTVHLEKPVTARTIGLRSIREVNGNAFAGVAEINIIAAPKGNAQAPKYPNTQ